MTQKVAVWFNSGFMPLGILRPVNLPTPIHSATIEWMGSKGRRQRGSGASRRQRQAGTSVSHNPPVMWPEAGSGFEADPFSPAGTAQREWMLTQKIGRSFLGKVIACLILASIVIPIVWVMVSSITSH
jgi:hypothetical protein